MQPLITGISGATCEGVQEWSIAVNMYAAKYELGLIALVIEPGSIYDRSSTPQTVPPPVTNANASPPIASTSVPPPPPHSSSSRATSAEYWAAVPSITSEHIEVAQGVEAKEEATKAVIAAKVARRAACKAAQAAEDAEVAALLASRKAQGKGKATSDSSRR